MKKLNSIFSWINSKKLQSKGQALIIHGLNLKPSKMNKIANELFAKGYDVLTVTLSGHGEEFDLSKVSFKTWMDEVSSSFLEFQKKNSKFGGKKIVVGYSLGALLLEIYLLKNPQVNIDEVVYFAPAFKIRKRVKLISSLFFLPDSFIIPSFSLKEYRAQKGTSIKAYKALFEGLKEFSKYKSLAFKNKTTVFLSKKDEFISFFKTKKFLESFKMVSFVELSKSASSKINPFHHLIIDQDVLGREEWAKKVKPVFDKF